MDTNKNIETYYPGKLIITNFKMQFIKDDDYYDIFKREYYSAPLFLIQKLEKYIDNKKQTVHLEILFKDYRQFKFKLNNKNDVDKIVIQLNRLIMNESVNDTPAYEFYKYNKSLEEKHKGWQIYSIEEEFNR